MANNFSIVTGTPKDSSWSQAYFYRFGSTEILILISLHKQGVFDLPMYGNKLAEDIYQQLISQLPLSLDELKKFVQTLTPPTSNLQLQLGLAIIKNNYLQLVIQGNLACFLFRNQPIVLLQSPSNLTGLTGNLQTKDVLLITTQSLANFIQPNLQTFIHDRHLPETLTRLVHAQTDSSQLTGLIYHPLNHHQTLTSNLKFPHFPKLPLFKSPFKKLRSSPPKNNRFIAFSLLIFFFLSLVFGFYKRSQLNRDANFHQLQTAINQNLNQINQLATTNPDQALNLLKTSQKLIDTYLQKHSQDGFKNQTNNLYQQLQTLKTNLFHFYHPQLQPYLDLSNLVEFNQLHQLSQDSQTHLLALPTNQAVILLNLNDKSTFQLKLPQSPIATAIWNQNLFVLESNQIDRISLKTHQSTPIIQAGDYWQQPRFLNLYAGNIYLLDPNQGEIWKYPILNHGYGRARRWFATGITPNLSQVIDFKIDGYVWFLTDSGKLESYLHGVPTKFKLHGLISQLDHPTSFLLTNSEVFVLEPSHQRLLVFSKNDGSYLRQYLNQAFKSARQIFFDQGWIYVWHDHLLSRFKP